VTSTGHLEAADTSSTPFASEFGVFELRAFGFRDGSEHAALVTGNPSRDERPLVRIQSSCLTGTSFGALLCDCRQQLHEALRLIAREGSGCVIYLDQEGRGHGLVEKIRHIADIAAGSDTVEAALRRGVPPDARDYDHAASILKAVVGTPRPIRLLTNNPEKIARLEASGVQVGERLSIETEPTDGNREYLLVKKRRMGHLLTRV
jgi:3,4-dihydroxy 2-butanone 4-phosphate synthase/GTP cyclohydrolase II